MASVTLKQGEVKFLTLTVKDKAGDAVNLSGATLSLGLKLEKSDSTYAIEKEDSDFIKTSEALGIVLVGLTEEDTNQPPGTYIGELMASWVSSSITEKSADFYLQISGAIIPVPEIPEVP